MKKLLSIVALCLIMLSTIAQEPQTKKQANKKFSSGITIYNDFWQGDLDNVSPRFLNQGAEVFFTYNIPVERSPLLFTVGSGIGSHNFYSNTILQQDDDGVYQYIRVDNVEKDTAGNLYNYKKSKMSVTYWDFPFELRYNAKKGFRAGVGMKFGFVLNSLTKYKGDDLTGGGGSIKIKNKDLKNLETWRYAVTASVGYKWVELYGAYSLTNIFKKDKGPELFPISVGLNLRPLFLN
ncbi:MAG: outer membrane beta-barrel protein [Bacteroidales bacterium]